MAHSNPQLDDQTAILLVASSEYDANMYYATRFFAPDTFIYLETNQERLIVIGNLELERARATAKVDRVLPLVHYWKLAQEKHQKIPGTEEVVDVLLRDFGIQKVIVPPNFNVKFADGIRKYGYEVEVKLEPFFERRLRKEPDEVEAIRETIRYTEAAIHEGLELIRRAKVSASGQLMFGDQPLTAEMVRRQIHSVLAEYDLFATHTVVSCGPQTALPHEEGSGPLYEGQPIIIDCAPRSRKNGYYCDITRTIVRGAVPDPLQRQYETVLEAQEYCYSLLKPGANGKEVHAAVARFFESRGYKTHVLDGKPQGFFHATGHGIGVEAHERPRLALRDEFLEVGNVLAIEPGLYYADVGGCRVEDDVLLTEEGPQELTSLDKKLQLD